VTVLTGAGISTDSGIPDFRGPNGVWTRSPASEKLFTIDNYLADPEVRRRSWQARRANPAWAAEPNAGHRALVDLERAGALRALVTQNIDRLHQAAGSSPEVVLELHGNMVESMCTGCDARGLTADALARLDAGEDDPRCERCGGILKTATVMFG
jgi:NAD-dependent deacetylase